MQFRQVTVARSDRSTSFVTSGLEQGDLVIVSSIDAVTEGMLIRLANADTAPASANLETGS